MIFFSIIISNSLLKTSEIQTTAPIENGKSMSCFPHKKRKLKTQNKITKFRTNLKKSGRLATLSKIVRNF